jgi:hypothetical protein
VEAFWAGEGRRIEATVRATALELSAASEAFSSAGWWPTRLTGT